MTALTADQPQATAEARIAVRRLLTTVAVVCTAVPLRRVTEALMDALLHLPRRMSGQHLHIMVAEATAGLRLRTVAAPQLTVAAERLAAVPTAAADPPADTPEAADALQLQAAAQVEVAVRTADITN